MCIIVTTTTKWNYDEQMKQNEMFATPAHVLLDTFLFYLEVCFIFEVNTKTW